MKTLRFIILTLLTLMGVGTYAQQPTISMQAPSSVVEGAKFTFTVRVTNGNSVSAPQAPQVNDCTHLYGPTRQQTQSYQVINGKASSSNFIDFTFTFRADKAGETTIPAISVNVDGKKMSTNATKVKILPPDKQSPGRQQGGNRQVPATGSAADISPDDVLIRISLNRNSVYEQEPVVATMKIYSTYNISSFRTISQPTFDGFFSEEIPVQSQTEIENYNGKNYYTCVLRKILLYPQKAGKLTITSGEYELTLVTKQAVSLGFIIDYRPVEIPLNTKSNSTTLTVVPLPEPKPAGFTGAVGNYTATAEMKPLSLKTNEVTSYIYKVTGTGNIKYLTAPQLNIPAGIDKLTPKTDIDAHFTGNDMKGSFTVNFSLMPQNPGEIEIPSQSFVFFNPHDKAYHTIDLPSFTLNVEKGAQVTSAVEQTSISRGMTDILHIKPITTPLSRTPKFVFHTVGYWALYLGLIAALIILILVYRRHLQLSADVKGTKMAKAAKQAAKRIKQAKSYMDKHETDKFYIELNQAMLGYLSDKLGIPVSGLVRDNISNQLAAKGVDQAVIDQAISVLDDCEMARFASASSDSEMSALVDKAVDAIKAIESTKVK